MRELALGAFAAAMFASLPAHAQTTAKEEAEDIKMREQFRLCRAAVIYEEAAKKKSNLPEGHVTALKEQINFIIFDSTFNLPMLSYKDGENRGGHAERWILEFSRTIGSFRDQLDAPENRESIMLDCSELVWRAMKKHLDALIKWRAKAMGLDENSQILDKPGGAE